MRFRLQSGYFRSSSYVNRVIFLSETGCHINKRRAHNGLQSFRITITVTGISKEVFSFHFVLYTQWHVFVKKMFLSINISKFFLKIFTKRNCLNKQRHRLIK